MVLHSKAGDIKGIHDMTYLTLFHISAAEYRWASHGETDKDGDGKTSELHFRYGFLDLLIYKIVLRWCSG